MYMCKMLQNYTGACTSAKCYKTVHGQEMAYLWLRCSIKESTKCSMGGACSSAWGQSSDGKLANSRSKLKVYDLLTMSRITPGHDVTHAGSRRSNKKKETKLQLAHILLKIMQQQLRCAAALKTCVPRQHNVKPHNSVLISQVVENVFSVCALQYGALAGQLHKLFSTKTDRNASHHEWQEKHHTTSSQALSTWILFSSYAASELLPQPLDPKSSSPSTREKIVPKQRIAVSANETHMSSPLVACAPELLVAALTLPGCCTSRA